MLTFRSATTVITALHRIGVRKLIADMGLPVKNGEEARAIPLVLQKLSDLADDVGGPAPLPPRLTTDLVEELLDKSGNEQFAAVYDARDRLFGLYSSGVRAKELRAQRDPRWRALQRLLAHASTLSVATKIRPQVEAILGSRNLLTDPDPAQPLITELSAALRCALQAARQRLVDARETELEALEGTEEWDKLSDAQWRDIFGRHHLGPVGAVNIGTEEQLLATLDEKPLPTWEDWAVSVPAHMRAAREEAAKLLEPEAVRVRPRPTTLHTAGEVDAYLGELRSEILEHIEAGKPVIL